MHGGPYVPFDDLKSEEAQAKLSACRPASAFENHTVREGVPRYSPLGCHIQSRGRDRRASQVVARRVQNCTRWALACCMPRDPPESARFASGAAVSYHSEDP